MFNQEYKITWNQFSCALDFAANCSLDLELATRRFNILEFWEAITGLCECEYPRTNEIQNPTLRFLHRWIGVTLFLVMM
jgi:hypothetical protein